MSFPFSKYIDGHGRTPLVSQNTSVASGGNTDFGAFSAKYYSRFTGFWSTVGSLILRIRTGVASGSYQVTSTTVMNSGTFTFDMPNYGQAVALDFTASCSTAYTLLFNGEPLR